MQLITDLKAVKAELLVFRQRPEISIMYMILQFDKLKPLIMGHRHIFKTVD